MFKFIDDTLNSITMYRLVLYYLIWLILVAMVLSFFGVLSVPVISIVVSVIVLLTLGWATNILFGSVWQIPASVESVYISALILALIISPPTPISAFTFLGWAAILTMASKFILTIRKKHIFNPVAIALVITSLAANLSASWWVGTAAMAPFVVLGGLLIVRKIHRHALVNSFFITTMVVSLIFTIINHQSLLVVVHHLLLDSPIWFFALVMLTEPLTSPPTSDLQMAYGVLVGFLFTPQVHFGSLYFSPEMALVVGNIFSYIVSPKYKLVLKLSQKIQLTPDTYDFVFTPEHPIKYRPGQYMEWTLGHAKSDNRGNRRYFTLASSPTESTIRLGVKFYEPASSFKKALLALDNQSTVIASQLAGDFTLPKDENQKLVFISGGIGVTPFRSMIKYVLDTGKKYSITHFYINKTPAEVVYKDVFDAAEQIGIKTIYHFTNTSGYLTADIIKSNVPDYLVRHYYLSGPHSLVSAYQKLLVEIGVPDSQVITDFFPGFA